MRALADAAGIDADGLAFTVSEYNAALVNKRADTRTQTRNRGASKSPLSSASHQCAFATTLPRLESVLDDFIRGLSRSAKNLNPDGTVIAKYINGLKSSMAATVLVKDNTDAGAFFDLPPLDAQALSEKFIGNGYFRFGCYAEITTNFGNNLDGAVAMFISFKVGKDAPSPAAFNTAVGVRAFFDKNGQVSQVTLTDKLEAIKATFEAKAWDCNGFRVTRPVPD
ncbi:MAG: hypothetical protein Q8M24_23785 [Pseudolabrys sp.]|nr:hypothetical protein [Pseudolabrys sp.]MDP2298473.1 hypothetical protein [Pseudolabrys sp.]